MVAGALFASIHALATVTFKVDQIVSGVVINLVAIGLARFLSTVFFGQATQSDSGQPHLNPIDIPGSIEPAAGTGQGLHRLITGGDRGVPAWCSPSPTRCTRPGGGYGCVRAARTRRPRGHSVSAWRRLRYQGVMLSGALAGFAGAFLAVEVNLSWNEGQTQGLGFIALAALILFELEPQAPDGGGADLRLRAGDPVAARRRPDHRRRSHRSSSG